MSNAEPGPIANRQLPRVGEVFLDHVGHFVADPDAAAQALVRAGFAPAPVSVQVNPDPAGGPPKLTGTGNVCAMLRAGYVEVLFKTADTPLGAEFEAARRRYDGLHLVAFAVADAALHHGRLASLEFPMQPLVKMQRPVDTAAGPDIARFEVVRVQPGAMAEGRVQMLLHQTEAAVWQPRWLDHPNGAIGLGALTIVVGDVSEAASRFERFMGAPAMRFEGGACIKLDRGEIRLVKAAWWGRRWPEVEIPSLPFMGECTIEVASLARARKALEDGGFEILAADATQVSVRFPAALGEGVWTFTSTG